MAPRIANPFALTAPEIAALIRDERPLLPELEPYRGSPGGLADQAGMRQVLAQTEPLLEGIQQIPPTGYTHYRYFIRNGDRKTYETSYFLKRRAMAALALRVFLGDTHWKDLLQDYLWNICEETTWVLPAHERRDPIDLFSAETGFGLASTLHLLGRTLDGEVRARVRREIDERIFQYYLAHPVSLRWYLGTNNWSGVCNSSVAAAFLLIEPEPDRVAQALATVLPALDHFLDAAFEKDGTSTEGVGYWHYGLMNTIALSEMLYARTGGAIDLLDSERIRRIASYPARMQLSGSMFAAFSDADEEIHFNPGVIARLAERTGETSLYNLLTRPVDFPGDWRLTMMLRNGLWWDGQQKDPPVINDAVLYGGGVARLVASLACCDQPVITAIKAGHNAENHNQNDVGSFVVHVDGESLLTDPGRGLYSRFYFGEQRYENIFANSYGHSLPRIGGLLESPGAEYRGELVEVQLAGTLKKAVVEFPRAYAVAQLAGLRRELRLAVEGEPAGTLWLEDSFLFSSAPLEIEEAFVTWCEVELDGPTAMIRGQRHSLRLVVETPAAAAFAVQSLEEACQANNKPGVLKRLTLTLPPALQSVVRVRMEVL